MRFSFKKMVSFVLVISRIISSTFFYKREQGSKCIKFFCMFKRYANSGIIARGKTEALRENDFVKILLQKIQKITDHDSSCNFNTLDSLG